MKFLCLHGYASPFSLHLPISPSLLPYAFSLSPLAQQTTKPPHTHTHPHSNLHCKNSKGTNSLILETQTAGFRALLPDHYEYCFFDGEEPFESYPAISNVFPGPYFCYYRDNSMRRVREAHEYVGEMVEEDGGY